MLSLPINGGTFRKSFLDGNGEIEIHSDGDVWRNLFANGLKFQKDPGKVDQVADLKVGVNSTRTLTLGKGGGFSLTFGGGFEVVNQIQLIWPNGTNQTLADYGLDFDAGAGQLYLRLFLSAKGDASAAGSFQAPAGVQVNFGLKAGGHASYEFLKRCDANDSAKAIVSGLFQDLVLPQQLDTKEAIPAAGDLAITRFGGYLGLSAGLTWGYSLTGTKSFAIRELALDLDYALKLSAAISAGYRLAGDFEIQARRGSEPDWVRFTVRKSKESEFTFAADLGLDASFDLQGLPESADDFIAKLAGADVESILRGLNKARELSTLEALEAEVNRLGKTAVDQLALKWLAKALDNDNVEKFFEIVGRVVDEYDNIDNRIIQLYQSYLDKVPQLQEILDSLANLRDPDNLRAFLNQTGLEVNKRSWDLIQLVWGHGLYDLLLKQEEFAKFQDFVTQARNFLQDGAKQKVREFIQTVKQTLQLDPLFDQLRKIDSTDKLKALADEKLKGLVEQLVGKAFDKLAGTEFDKALQQIHGTLTKIEEFKQHWYAKLREAASQQFTLNLSYAYSRASSREALLDVEINLADPAGRLLAGQASKGEFAELLQNYTSSAVKIRQGILSHNLTKSAQLQINAVGWGFDRLVQVIQNSEHAIEAQSGGLLHVFTTATSIEQRKTQGRKFKETIASKFLLKTAAATFQPEDDPSQAIDARTHRYLIRTLRNMAVDYDLTFKDERTRAEELTQYLQFAALMGLLPAPEGGSRDPVAAMARQLNEQFPTGLGEVSIKYIVRYDDQAVRNAFRFSGETLQDLARQTMRQFISAKYTGMSKTDWAARLGFAYLSDTLAEASRNNELVSKSWSVTLPGWFTGSGPRPVELTRPMRQILDSLFRTELRYLDRLVAFDNLIDRVQAARTAVPLDELEKASREFVEMADNLDDWRENAFFAVFDRLVQVGSGGKGRRDSVMVIEVQPAKEAEIVRKILTSSSAASEGEVLAAAGLPTIPQTQEHSGVATASG